MNLKIIFLISSFFCMKLCAKRLIQKKVIQKKIEKKEINHNHQEVEKFDVVSLDDLINKNANILIKKCFEDIYFDVNSFALSDKFPYQACFKQPYVLYIPQGKVQTSYGFIFCSDKIIQDVVRVNAQNTCIIKDSHSKTFKYNQRIAVITQLGASNYFHWINEILGRLALLEMQGVEYDKLYVPIFFSYMKDSLTLLWDIDPKKILSLKNEIDFIQADMLIVPSLINKINTSQDYSGNYIHPILIKYVREKLLGALQKKVNMDAYNFPKRVFISRKDCLNPRKIINEDEIFELFAAKGFERYELTKMSMIEQIILFYNAEIIVAEHGAGLANILFCKPKTKIIEIFQDFIAIDYWWTSQVMNLDYTPIKATSVDANYFANFASSEIYYQAWTAKMKVPLDEIEKFVATL